jgi:exodeoxyribonuclease VII large subunit
MELLAALRRQRARLDESLRRRLDAPAQRADRAWLRLQALRPHARLERGATRLLELRRRLDENLLHPLVQRKLHLLGLARALDAVSPLATLRRGFTILRARDGTIIRSVAQTVPDQSVTATLSDGDIALRVESSS